MNCWWWSTTPARSDHSLPNKTKIPVQWRGFFCVLPFNFQPMEPESQGKQQVIPNQNPPAMV
jgi:hypothetical protein